VSFINVAPALLLDGRSVQFAAPDSCDWWADLAANEFVTPAKLRPSPVAFLPAVADVSELVEPVGTAGAGDLLLPSAGDAEMQPPISSNEDVVRLALDELEAKVCVPLSTPLIRAGPRPRRSRTPATLTPLRRSRRLAAKPRAANATVQAQMVLLRKLGIHVEADTVPADVAQRFRAAFGGGMSEEKKKVMQILLNGDFDLTGLGLDLEGLEDAAL
jgi:hypothetical protein